MEFEEIGQVWRDQTTGVIRRRRTEDLPSVLARAREAGSARRRRFARLAWIGALPMVLLFGYGACIAPNAVAAVGAVLMAGAAGVVAVRYRTVGRRISDATLPVREALEAEVAHLDALARLRRDAPWVRAFFWVGFGVYVLGVVAPEENEPHARDLVLGFYLALLLITEGLIYFMRQRGPQPNRMLKDELAAWLDSLDEVDALR